MNDHQDGTMLRRLLIVGIIVGLLVLLTTPFWLFRGDDDPTSPKQTAPTPSVAASMCGLEDGDQSIPTEGPKAKWTLVGKTAIPTSKTIGPGKIEDGVPECFAHSPIGAVFAAMAISAAGANAEADPAAFQARYVDPPDGRPGQRPGDPVVQFAGFRVDHYDKHHATVTLPLRATTGSKSGSLAAATVDLTWVRGDWRVERASLLSLGSLAGFVEWSGA